MTAPVAIPRRPSFLGPDRQQNVRAVESDAQWAVRLLLDMHKHGLGAGQRVDALVRALAHELGQGPAAQIPDAVSHVVARLATATAAAHQVRIRQLMDQPAGSA